MLTTMIAEMVGALAGKLGASHIGTPSPLAGEGRATWSFPALPGKALGALGEGKMTVAPTTPRPAVAAILLLQSKMKLRPPSPARGEGAPTWNCASNPGVRSCWLA